MPILRIAGLMAAAVLLTSAAGFDRPASADNPPNKEGRELHVVGLYEGVTRTGNEIHGGRATVTVDRPEKRVTLVLTAYESVTWEIKLKPKTTLEKVILGGYEPQAVAGVPASVDVIKAFQGGGASSVLRHCYQIESPAFRAFVEQVGELTNMPIASFQGAYAYRHDAPLVIDRVQDDPRLSIDYPKTTPLAELPDLIFPAVHMVGTGRHPFGVKSSYGDFTLGGPQVETLRPLPGNVSRLTFDPVNKKYYGISGHDVVEVDLVRHSVAKMDPGLDVPRISWPSDVAFDTRRGRLLLVTFGGGGYLYIYDVASKAWSVPAEKLGVAALAYHPKHDCLYGAGFGHPGGGKAVLRQFNPEGALSKDLPLGDPLLPGSLRGGPGPSGTQVMGIDEYVVIIDGPQGLRSEDAGSAKTHIYLVEPKTGKIWITYKGSD
jgi:hypothetical protein